MNIFALDTNPKLAAEYHMNSHASKMVLETAQILSTSHHILDPDKDNSFLYKPTHKNHPSCVWARSTENNYQWLYELFVRLSEEFTHRFGKKHLSFEKLNTYLKHSPININRTESLTKFSMAMPDECKKENPIEAYRFYYIKHKSHIAKWTNRPVPFWFKNEVSE